MSTVTTKVEDVAIKLKAAFDSSIHTEYPYSAYLPVYDETTTFPPLEPFDFQDRGLAADKEKTNLFSKLGGKADGGEEGGLSVSRIAPTIGTEIRGLQLSGLTAEQRDELALLIAERGVVVFRDQDFKDIGPEKQLEFARHFGPLHIHPVGTHVKDHLEFHNIYLGPDNEYRNRAALNRLTTTGFHSDVSYERQPPGVTILTLLSVPPTGGDTTWASQAAAYARLSEPIRALLEGLRAEHSGFEQAEQARRDGKFVRREPVRTQHPIVRIHPATGQKVLYVNPGFTKRIIGLKEEESAALLDLLFKHVSLGQDFQARVKWEPGTVALWDNRVTAHTAINDYDVHNPQEGLRHGVRLATQAEKPRGVDGLESTWE